MRVRLIKRRRLLVCRHVTRPVRETPIISASCPGRFVLSAKRPNFSVSAEPNTAYRVSCGLAETGEYMTTYETGEYMTTYDEAYWRKRRVLTQKP